MTDVCASHEHRNWSSHIPAYGQSLQSIALISLGIHCTETQLLNSGNRSPKLALARRPHRSRDSAMARKQCLCAPACNMMHAFVRSVRPRAGYSCRHRAKNPARARNGLARAFVSSSWHVSLPRRTRDRPLLSGNSNLMAKDAKATLRILMPRIPLRAMQEYTYQLSSRVCSKY